MEIGRFVLFQTVDKVTVDSLFKMLIINIVFGINSMRKTCQEIEVNLAYRWFLGLSIDEKIPNFSTWSQNYIRRYKDSTIFEEIFMEILEQAVDYGFVDFTTVFGDSTHQKANANKRKSVKKEVEILKKKYEDDLLVEINEDRERIGKEAFDSMVYTEWYIQNMYRMKNTTVIYVQMIRSLCIQLLQEMDTDNINLIQKTARIVLLETNVQRVRT